MRWWDRRVTSPTLLAVWALGVALAAGGGWFGAGWFSAKLVLVVLLTGLHGVQAGALRRAADRAPGGRLAWTPAVCAVSVAASALLAVAKPF